MTSLDDLQDRMRRASRALHQCPTLRNVQSLSEDQFRFLLLQRRFLSLAFTPFYDVVIDALPNSGARLVCRQILREEYPDEGGTAASHREQLVDDLIALGISRDDILLSRPTPVTTNTIARSFELVPTAVGDKHREVALIATVACFAEALVKAEYRALVTRIKHVLPLDKTVFFGPHIRHDDGHAKRLLDEARVTIDKSAKSLRTFDAALKRCVDVKLGFYQQFANGIARSARSIGSSDTLRD